MFIFFQTKCTRILLFLLKHYAIKHYQTLKSYVILHPRSVVVPLEINNKHYFWSIPCNKIQVSQFILRIEFCSWKLALSKSLVGLPLSVVVSLKIGGITFRTITIKNWLYFWGTAGYQKCRVMFGMNKNSGKKIKEFKILKIQQVWISISNICL